MTLVRTARLEDSDAVFELSAAMAVSFDVERPAFAQALTSILETAGTHLLVAEVAGRVRGYLLGFVHPTFYANGPAGWVEEVAVHHEARRLGLGSALMTAFEAAARAQGCRLNALATRRAAPFYRALGYEASADYFRKLL